MKVEPNIAGIMQPYFFPYFEQFRLIAACDVWIVFDTPQFSRKSWITRNRILNRDKGTSYISVAVRHTGLNTCIKDAEIDADKDWRSEIMNKLKVYQSCAPHYEMVREFIGDMLGANYQTIAALNIAALKGVCGYLGLDTPILVASALALDIPSQCEPGEWALQISKALGATEYRNAAGGKALFDAKVYADNGINLSFHVHRPRTYDTGPFDFVHDLSVIDWMMWNDRATLNEWLA